MSVPETLSRILGDCDHGAAYLARPSGTRNVGWWCDACTRWVSKERGCTTLWLPHAHPDLEGKQVNDLPTIGERIYRRCQGCQTADLCELHHVAPKKFFGDEADVWPVIYLCRRCHERWHEALTPGLCTTYSAEKHLKTLLSYLRPEHIRALARALYDHCMKNRGAA